MKVFVVFFFGILGGIARLEINDYLPKLGNFPLATLLINLLGCFLFAFFIKNFLVAKQVAEIWILAAGTGFLGAFTTFSSAILDTYKLLSSGNYLLMFLYILLEIVGGLAMIVFGTNMARKLVKV
ncbi:MAG: CrcB family protein [Streptococcaceae bacterium]|jgi:CrcB protein|nr:CrcB family protein [Streptococcaceae bacterium]